MVDSFLRSTYEIILEPVIFLLFGVSFLIFLWGIVVFMRDKDSDEGIKTGRQNIIWGIIGMLIMVSVFGIINIIAGTIGVDVPVRDAGSLERDLQRDIDVKDSL